MYKKVLKFYLNDGTSRMLDPSGSHTVSHLETDPQHIDSDGNQGGPQRDARKVEARLVEGGHDLADVGAGLGGGLMHAALPL